MCGSDDYHDSLSLRGGNEVTDAAIHRVSRDAYDLSLRLLVHSGSPRAYALAMTNVKDGVWLDDIHTLSLRGGTK